MQVTTEIWGFIPGFNNFYQASTIGRIKSIQRVLQIKNRTYTVKEKILAPIEDSWGYYCFNSPFGRMRIHRAVALTFLENKNNLETVNHKNGIKSDNRTSNLEWCSNVDNVKHAHNTGLIKGRKIKVHLTQDTPNEVLTLILKGKKKSEISRELGITPYWINMIQTGKFFTKRYFI